MALGIRVERRSTTKGPWISDSGAARHNAGVQLRPHRPSAATRRYAWYLDLARVRLSGVVVGVDTQATLTGGV